MNAALQGGAVLNQQLELDQRIVRTSTVLRWTSYSAAHLPLLVRQHGFPLPLELSHLDVGWLAHEVTDWINVRNQHLLTRLI